MTSVLIDSDIVLWHAAASTEYTVWSHETEGTFRRKRELTDYLKFNYDEDDPVYTPEVTPSIVKEPIVRTYRALDSIISKIVRECDATSYLLVVKGKQENFRVTLDYPVVYKGQRGEKPSNFEEARAYLLSLPNIHECAGPWEVDDELGILQDKVGQSTIIASTDKDVLYGLPGWKYNMDTEKRFYVSPHEAEVFFWRQMLMGDRVDNILGVKGIGPKTAEKLITHRETRDAWREVVKTKYQETFGKSWQLMYDSNAKFLWILRSEENEPPNPAL